MKVPGDDSDCVPRDSVDALLASWAAARPDLDFSPVAVVARLGGCAATSIRPSTASSNGTA